jgi:hypothetical protein
MELGLRFNSGFVKGEQFGLQTRIAATENVSLCGADEKMTAGQPQNAVGRYLTD